jgi:peptidoglycan/LPS O-acetylase OafA/YrhL
VYIGKISYSLYLFHQPAFVYARARYVDNTDGLVVERRGRNGDTYVESRGKGSALGLAQFRSHNHVLSCIFGLCIAMSSTSYYFLEQPARNFDSIETRTVVIACLVSLIALAVIGVMLMNVNCVDM